MSANFTFPDPAPLSRAALIKYQWGTTEFEILSTACSVRSAPWPETGEEMNWLHCKAMRTAEVNPNGPTGMMTVLIPAHYVTSVQPGPTFRLERSRRSNDLGIFPPNQPTPANHLPLEQIEAAIAALWDPVRN